MIKFQCNNCGKKFSAPEIHAGKKGMCPKCKSVVVVPQIQKTGSVPKQKDSSDSQTGPRYSTYDLTLLEVPEAGEAQEQSVDEPSRASGQSGEIVESTAAQYHDSVTERRFPWPIDIFLYPASKSGLTILSIIIAIRWFSKLVIGGLGYSTPSLSPLVVIVVPLLCISIIVRIIFYLYFIWYLRECIRDSTEGGVRAPETLGRTPGLGEMLWLLRSIIVFILFAAPAFCYYLTYRQTDIIFCAWFIYGVLFLPMGLLAFVMFDSISGLNPFLLIGSIRSTFLPYCAIILPFSAAGILILKIVPETDFSLLQKFVIHCIVMYLLMVAAHLLGWFFNRYKQQLNWDV